MSSGIPPPRPGMSTPAKKAPFRPSSVHPNISPSATSSPVATQITPPKSKIPTFTTQTRSPSNSLPPSPSHTPTTPASQPAALLRAAPNLNKKHADKRLSGEISAARSYMHAEAALSSAAAIQSQVVSQADRRNKLKKRALIQQTEKIKELLWEKASLMQKKQLMDDEQRELDTLKRKVEDEREERQKAWVMEEAQRREEEEEELRYAVLRMRKYAQRYDFELAKREKMIASKEAKDKKRSNYAAEVAEANKRSQEERSRLAEGIRDELDDTLPPDTLLDAPATTARPPPTLETTSPTAAAQLEVLSPSTPGAASPGSVTSQRSFSSNSVTQPPRRPSESTASTVSDGDVARELHATGFPAAPKQQPPAEKADAENKTTSDTQELLELNDDTIANADGILDEDDVTFVSSDDDSDDEEEKEMSRRGSRRSSGSALKAAKAAQRAEREEKEQEEREKREQEEREKRERETEKEREEREKREQEDRERKDREWQELKERLMNEARELQEAERQRLQREREEEQRVLAANMAAKEAEMNELLAKLKEVEAKGVPALPALPDAQPLIGSSEPAASAPAGDAPSVQTSAARSVTTPPEQLSTGASTPKSALPPLSSISLRSASHSLAQRQAADDEIDEPTQAPGAQNALPSLSSTPVRRLVAASTTAASSTSPPKPRKADHQPSESMAISSMLHELEQLEEEEEMMLRMGLEVRKVPRMGKSKVVKLYIDKNEADEWIVRWDSKKKNKDEASITLAGCKVVTGMQAGLFLKPENAERFSAQRNCCFSILAADRTLDVVAMTHSDQDLWTRTLTRLAKRRPKHASTLTSPQNSAPASRLVSPANSAPGSRRGSGFVTVGSERSLNKQAGGGAELSAGGDPSKEIENYLSRHLKNF